MALRIVSLTGRPLVSIEGPARSTPPEPAAEPPAAEEESPSLEGMLAPGQGARVLMNLFMDERTGRLVLEGLDATPRVLLFLAGEPVHLVSTDGGAAVERRVRERGRFRDAAAGRTPLATLARRSSAISVLEALREEVREACRQLFSVGGGSWRFFDDPGALDTAPLTAVNPFGLVVEAQLRATPAVELLSLAEKIGPLHVVPLPGFANASPRLRSFSGGVDLADLVDGSRTVRELIPDIRLDTMMGSLVLQAMVDTGLLQLSQVKKPLSERQRRRVAKPNSGPAVAQSDVKPLSQLGALPAGATELLSLYLELKPEVHPDLVLGLTGSAGVAAIERAYQQRLAELDPRAIPAGAHRPYLLARAEELRAKVERAYQTRMAGKPRAKTTAAYQLLDRIGSGGMAEVFRGTRSDDPHTFVAIKCILKDLRSDPKFAEMFLEEARLARRIQHANVVRVLTVGRGTDDLYLAMEYVDGLDFADLLRRARKQGVPTPIELVCRVVADASAGLHAAHTARDASGVVTPILHRDVSPQNILVSRTGEVKLSDFGIAKAMGTQDEERGAVKGKVPYFAPELLKGVQASVRTDVYAMAMTLYAAVGSLPFQRNDRFETMRAILNDPLPPLSRDVPEVPPVLDALLATAAARNPDERHASAQQFQLELEEILATRPAVDVAGWARQLAGRPVDPGAPARPITTVRSTTGLTGVAHTDPTETATTLPGAARTEEVDVDVDVSDL